MKKNRLFAAAGAMSIAITGLLFAFLCTASVTTPQSAYMYEANNNKYRFISHIKESTLNIKALHVMGIVVKNTSLAPKITPQQAFEWASNTMPAYTRQASQIVVEYYALTDRAMRLSAPCYIISFKGITKQEIVPYGVKAKVLHEYNVGPRFRDPAHLPPPSPCLRIPR